MLTMSQGYRVDVALVSSSALLIFDGLAKRLGSVVIMMGHHAFAIVQFKALFFLNSSFNFDG